MALGSGTVSDIAGAASDLFAGFGAESKAQLQAEGLQIQSEGTEISAESSEITAEGLRTKAQGDIAEAQNYTEAAGLATANAEYTNVSTRIQQSQQARQETQTLGATRAGVAGSGFSNGGSAFYLMKEGANQGALASGTIGMQGAITAAGYTEQAKSFTTMAQVGMETAASEEDIANKTDTIAGQQRTIAGQQQGLAAQTLQAGQQAATGDFIGAALKGAAAVASVFTGGISDDVIGAVGAVGGDAAQDAVQDAIEG